MRLKAAIGLGLALAIAWALLRRRTDGPAPMPAPAPAEEVVDGYCVKERKKVIIEDPQPTVTKNGRNAVRGVCPDCGTKIFRFV